MMSDFGKQLIGWYNKNKRDLPWRKTSDPYKIWLSEIIFQQTRINQGLTYYQKFLRRFPDVFELASADSDEVYNLWQGLGYYNRAANLMETARHVASSLNGRFPETYEELLCLKGIGPYTAAAIASIAFGVKKPVVDGNVYRLITRMYAISEPINTSQTRKKTEQLCLGLMDDLDPGEFNQAMMEFGALYCKPAAPDCQNCLFRKSCKAFSERAVGRYPVLKKKNPIKNRYFYYLVIENKTEKGTGFWMTKRNNSDIWKNLYEFPLIESPQDLPVEEVLKQKPTACASLLSGITANSVSATYRHQLTHQQINAVFIRFIVNKISRQADKKPLFLIEQNKMITYPVSRLTERYLQDEKLI